MPLCITSEQSVGRDEKGGGGGGGTSGGEGSDNGSFVASAGADTNGVGCVNFSFLV